MNDNRGAVFLMVGLCCGSGWLARTALAWQMYPGYEPLAPGIGAAILIALMIMVYCIEY